jgi:signal transduction histidine kinase
MTYDTKSNKVSVDFVSDNFYRVTKCSIAEFRNYFKFAEMFVSDERTFLNIFDKNLFEKSALVREYQVYPPRGGAQELLDYCYFTRIGGNLIRYEGIIINRTAEKITDLALHISEGRLMVALEGAGAGFFDWVRGCGGIIFGNVRMLGIRGIEGCEVKIKQCLRTVAPGFLKLCFDTLRNILSGRCINFSLEFNLRENERRWLWISGKVISSDPVSGQPCRIAGTIRDITVSKQVAIERERINEILEERIRERTAQLEHELATKSAAEQQLIENLKKERELNDAKSMFVNMVSHEFRTPLAIIQGATDLLRYYEGKLADGEREECLSSVNKAIQRMTHTMDGILLLGRMQSNQLKFSPTETDVLLTFYGILDDVEGIQGSKRIVFEISADLPAKLHIDTGLLYHIVTNLLSNALKYSPTEKHVMLSLRYGEGELEIFVEDFGIGIPEKDRVNIFKIFHRGSNVSNKQGIGIGMFVVKYCVNLHHGSMAISSEEGVGTIFRIKLPAPEVGS